MFDRNLQINTTSFKPTEKKRYLIYTENLDLKFCREITSRTRKYHTSQTFRKVTYYSTPFPDIKFSFGNNIFV